MDVFYNAVMKIRGELLLFPSGMPDVCRLVWKLPHISDPKLKTWLNGFKTFSFLLQT